MYWIYLDVDRDKLRALVQTAMNFQASQEPTDFMELVIVRDTPIFVRQRFS
jgi:hypothetical protein